MTPNQAREFLARYPQGLSYIKPSHLEELNPLLEVAVEAVIVQRCDFHDLRGTFAPKKETLDRFAAAAGIQFNQLAESTRREGDGCYVGTAQAYVLGPDGKAQNGPVCEYEFDVEVRLEELKLNRKTAWENGQKTVREFHARELAQERLTLMKVGRQRANTGARSRAIVAVLGMQTGFKDLFPRTATTSVPFLFSRVIWNAKNRMVMDAMIDNLKGTTMALYGPAHARVVEQLPAPAAMAPTDTAGDYDPFAPEEVLEISEISPETTKLQTVLVEWLNADIPTKARTAITEALDRGESDPTTLHELIARVKTAADKMAEMKRAGGIA